jgi:hypothetical protein
VNQRTHDGEVDKRQRDLFGAHPSGQENVSDLSCLPQSCCQSRMTTTPPAVEEGEQHIDETPDQRAGDIGAQTHVEDDESLTSPILATNASRISLGHDLFKTVQMTEDTNLASSACSNVLSEKSTTCQVLNFFSPEAPGRAEHADSVDMSASRPHKDANSVKVSASRPVGIPLPLIWGMT